MSSSLKRAAAEALIRYLRDNLPPSLGVTIAAGAADPEDRLVTPTIRLLPQDFEFIPFQEDSVDDSPADRHLIDVGEFVGDIEMRLVGCSGETRETLEDSVTNLFLAQELRPGVIVAQTRPVTVGGWSTAYTASCAYILESAIWHDEAAFSKRRYTYLTISTVYPALVMRKPDYTINELIAAFNMDLEDAVQEQISIDEDGNITNVP